MSNKSFGCFCTFHHYLQSLSAIIKLTAIFFIRIVFTNMSFIVSGPFDYLPATIQLPVTQVIIVNTDSHFFAFRFVRRIALVIYVKNLRLYRYLFKSIAITLKFGPKKVKRKYNLTTVFFVTLILTIRLLITSHI